MCDRRRFRFSATPAGTAIPGGGGGGGGPGGAARLLQLVRAVIDGSSELIIIQLVLMLKNESMCVKYV